MRDPDLLIRLTSYYMAGAIMMFITLVIMHRFHKRDYLQVWALSWMAFIIAYLMLYLALQWDATGYVWVFGLFVLVAAFLQQRGMFMFVTASHPSSRHYAFLVMVGLFLTASYFGNVTDAGMISVFALSGVLYLDAGRLFLKTGHHPFVIYGGILIVHALVIAAYPLLAERTAHAEIIDASYILAGMAVAHGMVAMHLIDVFDTEQRLQDKLYYLSFHDHMTGLKNRAYLESFLDALDASDEVNATIMMTDLDTLKIINDKYGHAAGDTMILRASEALKDVAHESDLIVRYGGDEFVAVFANRDSDAMKRIERQIQTRIKHEVVEDIPLSMSIGYAVHTQNRSIYETLRQAEKRMYEHKRFEQ